MIGTDVKVYQPDFHEDFRGDIWTNWDEREWIEYDWRLDKFSTSSRGVLRGLHGDQKSHKLVSCVYGEVYLVIVNPERLAVLAT